MRTVLTLLYKDLRLFLRDRVALSLTFIVPAVLIYIFGHVFGVGGTGSGPGKIPLAVVVESESATVAAVVKALEQETAFRVVRTAPAEDAPDQMLTEAAARAMIAQNQLRFAVIFPRESAGASSFGVHVKVLANPRNEIETQTATGLLQKAIFTSAPQALFSGLRRRAEAFIGVAATDTFHRNLARTIAAAFDTNTDEVYQQIRSGEFGGSSAGADTHAANSMSAGNLFEQLVRIETEQVAGQAVKSPAATRSVGGWAIMFLLFSVSGAATSLFDEKRAGLFHRLLAAPVSRAHILWSKYLFCVGLGMVQLLALFGAGRLLFGIDVASNFGNLVVVALATALVCTAFGMLLASIARTPAAAQGLATFLILTMSAIGGAWFPVSLMPEFVQQVSKLTPVYWSMEGFLAVLWAGQGFREILPMLGVLLSMAVLINVLSLWRFSRGHIFR